LKGRLVGAALGMVLGLVVGCDTVDLGKPPAGANACRPSQQYFIDVIWPQVLDVDYGGKRCNDSGCHDLAAGRPLTLVDPVLPSALPLPMDWANNYRSTTEQMNCSNVAASALIMFPTGQRPHGGQTLFAPDSEQATLIKAWTSAIP
jgi:hypothetical protein